VVRASPGSQGERWWVNVYGTTRWWAGVFGLWTLFGMLMAGYAQLRFGQGRGYVGWLSTMLPFYWAWVPLTPAVVSLVSRFDFRGGYRLRSLAVHLAAGGVAILSHGLIYALLLTVPTPGRWDGLGQTVVVTLRRHAVGDLATYAVLSGAVLTLLQYRRAQDREREAAQAAIRATRLEVQLSAARLDALQRQLHPHFLFNALNSISVMVLKGAGAEAIRAIRQLADLLRVTLRTTGNQEVPLQEEVAFVQGYLEIEKLRFSDRLELEFEIAADTGAALVPHLILQPLVENAVIHGLRSRDYNGCIRVAAHRDNCTLRLEVSDDGAGLPADPGDRPCGVGLRNTRARLKELYGDSAYLHIGSSTGGGTTASISLPYHTDPHPDAGGAAW